MLKKALYTPFSDPDERAWEAAVLSAGGSVTSQRRRLIASLIKGLKSDGIWSTLDGLWLHAAEGTTQALRDLVARRVATAVSAPSFTADRGYLGNGTSACLTYGVAPSALVNYTQNLGFLAAYVLNGDGATNLYIGSADSGSGFTSETVIGTASTSFLLQAAGSATTFSQTAQNGMHIVERLTSTTGIVNNNGVDTASNTVATSSSRTATNLTSLGRNTSGAIDQFSGSRIAVFAVGQLGTAAKRAAFASRINAYMTAIGGNAY